MDVCGADHGVVLGKRYVDEQSGLGLFFTGNNPLYPKSNYASSDFDQTHVFLINYSYQLPKFTSDKNLGYLLNGWILGGQTVAQSGQPYSVVDYSGAVGSIFYGVNDGITNPVVPLSGCSPKQALTGSSGAHANPDDPNSYALKASCFGLPLLNPGDLNGAIPSNDPYETNFIAKGERNIFRQTWQRRADISIAKVTQLTEKVSLKYTFDVFNLTNTASFDIPIDDVSQNINFQGFPYATQPSTIPPCDSTYTALYVCPTLSGLGITNKTIGSPRQIQMSLRLTF